MINISTSVAIGTISCFMATNNFNSFLSQIECHQMSQLKLITCSPSVRVKLLSKRNETHFNRSIFVVFLESIFEQQPTLLRARLRRDRSHGSLATVSTTTTKKLQELKPKYLLLSGGLHVQHSTTITGHTSCSHGEWLNYRWDYSTPDWSAACWLAELGSGCTSGTAPPCRCKWPSRQMERPVCTSRKWNTSGGTSSPGRWPPRINNNFKTHCIQGEHVSRRLFVRTQTELL